MARARCAQLVSLRACGVCILEKVLLAYPKYVTVGRLPGDSDAQRLDIVQAMVEARLLLVRPPKEE